MTARDGLGSYPEPVPRHPALELQREEAIVAPGEHPGLHIRPALDRARLGEGDLGLGKVVPLPRGHDVRRHVMQEIVVQVDLGRIPARLRARDPGRRPPR
jgi:hypothetical protein